MLPAIQAESGREVIGEREAASKAWRRSDSFFSGLVLIPSFLLWLRVVFKPYSSWFQFLKVVTVIEHFWSSSKNAWGWWYLFAWMCIIFQHAPLLAKLIQLYFRSRTEEHGREEVSPWWWWQYGDLLFAKIYDLLNQVIKLEPHHHFEDGRRSRAKARRKVRQGL